MKKLFIALGFLTFFLGFFVFSTTSISAQLATGAACSITSTGIDPCVHGGNSEINLCFKKVCTPMSALPAGTCGIDQTGTYPVCPGMTYSAGRKDGDPRAAFSPYSRCATNSECCSGICVQPKSSSSITTDTQCNGNAGCLQALAQARYFELTTHQGMWVQDNGDGTFTAVCVNAFLGLTYRGPTPTTQTSLPTVTTGPSCNSPCNQPADCQGAQDGCTVCDTTTNTCKPPTTTNSCNAVCTRDADCVGSTGSQNTCPSCINGTCQATPACNSACVRDSDCIGATGAQGTCPVCQNGTCQAAPTPTPTLIPSACNVACTRDADCNGAPYANTNTCTACVGGTCKVPPACNSACVRDSDCVGATGAQGTCPVCANGTCQARPTNTPTPTPIPFSEDMCKCDGIEYSNLAGGQPAAITSFAKILTADQDIAKVVSQTFTLYEGTETTGKILMKSDPIASTFVTQDAEKARYKSVWNFNMPNLKDGATYRIQSKILCADKRTAANRVLIAQAQDNRSIFDAIVNFFAQLLGISNNAANTTAPTPTPFRGIISTQGDEASPQPTSSNLQLGTFIPVQVFQKTCTFIKFKAGFN